MTGSMEKRGSGRGGTQVRATMFALVAGLAAGTSLVAAADAAAQEPPAEAERITVEWNAAPMGDVLRAFAEFSGKSIVAGPDVPGTVTAFIDDQPWDVALQAILSAQGLTAVEDEHGIIRVGSSGRMDPDTEADPFVTRAYRLSFAKASELQGTLAPHLSADGSISVAEGTNTLIITDFESVHRTIAGLLR